MTSDFGIWKWKIIILKQASVIIAAYIMTKVKVLCMFGLIWAIYILKNVNRNFSPFFVFPFEQKKLFFSYFCEQFEDQNLAIYALNHNAGIDKALKRTVISLNRCTSASVLEGNPLFII